MAMQMLQASSSEFSNEETESFSSDNQYRRKSLDFSSLSASKAPRCSIFQEIAGDYRVDEDEDEALSVRREFYQCCLALASKVDHLSNRQRETSTSALSFTGSSLEQDSSLLQQYEGPIGWEVNHLFDLFDTPFAPLNTRDSKPCLSASSSTTSSMPSTSSEIDSTTIKSIYTGKSPSRSVNLVKNIAQAPSKACCVLFRRNLSKISPLGISNHDEPIHYLVSSS